MPGMSPERLARLQAAFKCATAVKNTGDYLSHRVTVGEDLKVTLYVYSVAKNDPAKVSVTKINDPSLVRLAHLGGEEPQPVDIDKLREKRAEYAEKNAATPAKGKK